MKEKIAVFITHSEAKWGCLTEAPGQKSLETLALVDQKALRDSRCDGGNKIVKMEPWHITQALGNARRILMRWIRKSPGRFWSGEGPDESEVSQKPIWPQLQDWVNTLSVQWVTFGGLLLLIYNLSWQWTKNNQSGFCWNICSLVAGSPAGSPFHRELAGRLGQAPDVAQAKVTGPSALRAGRMWQDGQRQGTGGWKEARRDVTQDRRRLPDPEGPPCPRHWYSCAALSYSPPRSILPAPSPPGLQNPWKTPSLVSVYPRKKHLLSLSGLGSVRPPRGHIPTTDRPVPLPSSHKRKPPPRQTKALVPGERKWLTSARMRTRGFRERGHLDPKSAPRRIT